MTNQPTGSQGQSIHDLDRALYAASAALAAAIQKRIPVGSCVSVRHGDGAYIAKVVGHIASTWNNHRVEITSFSSGKRYSVYATRLMEYRER